MLSALFWGSKIFFNWEDKKFLSNFIPSIFDAFSFDEIIKEINFLSFPFGAFIAFFQDGSGLEFKHIRIPEVENLAEVYPISLVLNKGKWYESGEMFVVEIAITNNKPDKDSKFILIPWFIFSWQSIIIEPELEKF